MAVCPSFSVQKDLHVDISEICASIVTYSVRNPGGTTHLYIEDEISLHKLRNLYENDKNVLAATYRTLLEKAIGKYQTGISVKVEAIDMDISAATYKLVVDITYQGVPVIKFNNIILGTDGKFNISF